MNVYYQVQSALQFILDEASDHPDDSLKDIVNEACSLFNIPLEATEEWLVIRK